MMRAATKRAREELAMATEGDGGKGDGGKCDGDEGKGRRQRGRW